MNSHTNNYAYRLVAYDRNHNFKPPLIEIPEATDIEWPKHGYKQLIADHRLVFSKVTREQIDGYFLFRLAGWYLHGGKVF